MNCTRHDQVRERRHRESGALYGDTALFSKEITASQAIMVGWSKI